MSEIFITDHALLRFIERVQGIDVESLREQLRQKALRGATAARKIGAEDYMIIHGEFQMRCIGDKVVTILRPKVKR